MSKKGSVDRMIDDAVIQNNTDLLSSISNILEQLTIKGIISDAQADCVYFDIEDHLALERKKIINRFED